MLIKNSTNKKNNVHALQNTVEFMPKTMNCSVPLSKYVTRQCRCWLTANEVLNIIIMMWKKT